MPQRKPTSHAVEAKVMWYWYDCMSISGNKYSPMDSTSAALRGLGRQQAMGSCKLQFLKLAHIGISYDYI